MGNTKDCENLTSLGCKARDAAKELMLYAMLEGEKDLEMCKEQCCMGCDKVCGFRCGRAR